MSCIIKRWTVANEACNNGCVSVDGRVVKASYDVKAGDEIQIVFGEKPFKILFLSVKDNVRKDEAADYVRGSNAVNSD